MAKNIEDVLKAKEATRKKATRKVVAEEPRNYAAKYAGIFGGPIRGAATYRFSPMGQARSQMHNNCATPAPVEPLFLDIPLHIGEIPQGESSNLQIELPWAYDYEAVFEEVSVHSFVFVGSRDLWLLPGSNAGGRSLVSLPTPMDAYRPNCPNRVSWGLLRRHDGLGLIVENRSRARNATIGEFVGRLICQSTIPV